MNSFNHFWFWKSKLPSRKGTHCRVLARGRKNSILVEFESDGYRVITSRNAVRRKLMPEAKPQQKPQQRQLV